MPEYTWDMKGYASKYGFYTSENLSRREAERTLQLEPEPPKESDLNNYIIQAQQQKDLRYLSFFLHHYEKMLNGRIYSFWRSDGNERYDPERFLDYKMTCVERPAGPENPGGAAVYQRPFGRRPVRRRTGRGGVPQPLPPHAPVQGRHRPDSPPVRHPEAAHPGK